MQAGGYHCGGSVCVGTLKIAISLPKSNCLSHCRKIHALKRLGAGPGHGLGQWHTPSFLSVVARHTPASQLGPFLPARSHYDPSGYGLFTRLLESFSKNRWLIESIEVDWESKSLFFVVSL